MSGRPKRCRYSRKTDFINGRQDSAMLLELYREIDESVAWMTEMVPTLHIPDGADERVTGCLMPEMFDTPPGIDPIDAEFLYIEMQEFRRMVDAVAELVRTGGNREMPREPTLDELLGG